MYPDYVQVVLDAVPNTFHTVVTDNASPYRYRMFSDKLQVRVRAGVGIVVARNANKLILRYAPQLSIKDLIVRIQELL